MMLNVFNHEGNAKWNAIILEWLKWRKQQKHTKCLGGCGLVGGVIHCYWEGKMEKPL